MDEGWLEDDYIILFGDASSSFEEAYALPDFLPAYKLVGLRGWDDFIVKDEDGVLFTAPTVPLLPRYLQPFEKNLNPANLVADDRRTGRIKWYLKPICFGGDPKVGANLLWVSLEQHAQLVKWWNQKYKEIASAP
jgi:hypothetical protein